MAMCVRFAHPTPVMNLLGLPTGTNVILITSYQYLHDGLQAADEAYKLHPAFMSDASERFRVRIMRRQLQHTLQTQEILPGFLDLDVYEKLRDLTLRLASLLT